MIRDRQRRRRENPPAGWVEPALWTLGGLGVFGLIMWAVSNTETALIGRLRPEVSALWDKLKAQAAAQGFEIRAISTVRSPAAQKVLVAMGRSAAPISWHNLGRAIDFQVKDAAGNWDDKAIHRDRYLKVARLAEGLGFRQLGFNADGSRRILKTADGRTFEDPYHIEYRSPHATIAAAIKAEAPQLLTA